jgi:hypothetical protein
MFQELTSSTYTDCYSRFGCYQASVAHYMWTDTPTIFQKGVCYLGIKMYSRLSESLKELSHYVTQLRLALKIILLKIPSIL